MLPTEALSPTVPFAGTPMPWLEHPTAQALRAAAQLSAAAVSGGPPRLHDFWQRSWPRFSPVQHQQLPRLVLHGQLSNRPRQTAEPVASPAGRHRQPVPHFVAAGCWDDEGLMAHVGQHDAAQRAAAEAVLVLDPSGWPRSGSDSGGLTRPGGGRRGPVDNGPSGVLLSEVTAHDYAPRDRQF